jgi:hypothetical protein
MIIITKSNLIQNVSERWDFQYRNTSQKDKIEKGNRLRAEKPKTEDEIAEIIGNKEWTRNICRECGNDCETTILLGYESTTVNICPDCLKRALSFL